MSRIRIPLAEFFYVGLAVGLLMAIAAFCSSVKEIREQARNDGRFDTLDTTNKDLQEQRDAYKNTHR